MNIVLTFGFYVMSLILQPSTTQELSSDNTTSQHELMGAWELISKNGSTPNEGRMIKIVSQNTFVYTMYNAENGQFLGTEGGAYTYQAGQLKETLEFCTWDAENVGKTHEFSYSFELGVMILSGNLNGEIITEVWRRIDRSDNMQVSPLAGAWRIRGRVTDGGQMSTIELAPRRTIKILSGTRFQWTAYNMATKEFMGCGGGTYTTKDGVYTEHIEYFSRDQSRVGMDLTFGFKREKNDWHHTGKSSKGDPINEIWTMYQ